MVNPVKVNRSYLVKQRKQLIATVDKVFNHIESNQILHRH